MRITGLFWELYAWVYDSLNKFRPYLNIQEGVVRALDLIPNLRILDAGCGTGNTSLRIFNAGVYKTHVCAVDASKTMLRRAKKKLMKGFWCEVLEADYNSVPGRFDRIVSVNSLYVSSDPVTTLKHWYDVLQDGGLLVIAHPYERKLFRVFTANFKEMFLARDISGLWTFICTLPVWTVLFAMNMHIARKAKRGDFHFLSLCELQSMAEENGFRTLSCETKYYSNGVAVFSFQKGSSHSIRRAQTSGELEKCYVLRCKIYDQIKSLSAENYPDGRELDLFDAYGTHFIRIKWEVVGCLRVIPEIPGHGFLLEEHFTVPPEIDAKRGAVLEISRMSVLSTYRHKNISFLLAWEAVKWGKENGYCVFIAACQRKVWEGYKKNEWSVTEWCEAEMYHNTLSSPGTLIPPLL